MIRIVTGIFFIFLSALTFCGSTIAATTKSGFSEKIIENDSRNNAVRVRCFINDNKFKLSIASVLNTPLTHRTPKKIDVALTTGHGLVGKDGKIIENCFVYQPNGRKVKIKAIKLAPKFKEASATDWAVIAFDRIKSRDLIRYNVDPSLSLGEFEKLAENQAHVQFAKARGVLENSQNCQIFARRNANLSHKNFEHILPHSCKAIGGQSGSPVSVAGVDNDIVIGIHLGQSFSLPIKNLTKRARWFGFMRVIDDAFLDELEAILLEIERAY